MADGGTPEPARPNIPSAGFPTREIGEARSSPPHGGHAPGDPWSLPGLIGLARRHLSDPLYRNGTYLMLNGATGALLGFGFWWLAARLFQPASVGFGAGVISAMTLVALISKFGFDAALIRFVPLLGAAGRRRLLLRALTVSGGGAFLLALGVSAVASRAFGSLAPLSTLNGTLTFAFGATTLSLAWVLDAFFVAEREARLTFFRNSVFNGTRIVAPLLIAPFAPLFGIPLAWAVAVGASLVIGAWTPRLMARHRERAEVADPEPFARFAAVNAVVAIGEFLAILLLPVLVLEFAGAEANARFYVAWTLASLAFLFSKAIAQSAFAELSSGRGVRDVLEKAARQHALVLFPLVAGMLIMGRFALGLFGPGYEAAYPVLVILAPSAFAVAITNVYVTLLRVEDRLVELAILPAGLAILAIAIAPYLITHTGLEGLALGWLGVACLGGAWSLRGLVRRATRATRRRKARAKEAEAS